MAANVELKLYKEPERINTNNLFTTIVVFNPFEHNPMFCWTKMGKKK